MAPLIFLILIVAGIFALVLAIAGILNRYLSEGEQWDIAASNMWMEGYTDLEIEETLGKRPK